MPPSATSRTKILPAAKEWRQRPLEAVYAVVFLDAIHYHVCSEGQVINVVKWGGKRSCGCGRKEANLRHAAMAKQASLYVDGTDLAKIASNKVPSNNRSGCKGVYFETSKQRWRAVIGFQGKRISLGYYANRDDAIRARKEGQPLGY